MPRTVPSVDVSVVIAVRNGVETILQTIDSVRKQEDCVTETIVVDGMSDDGTQEALEQYGLESFVYIRENDMGIYDAWNKALRRAQGRWCAFLGTGDRYFDEWSVSALLSCADRASREPGFVYGGILRVGGLKEYVHNPHARDVARHLRSGRMLPHPGSLHRTDALLEIGGFDASFRIAGDFDALLRLTERLSVQRCGRVTTVMRVGGMSDLPENRGLRNLEISRALSSSRGSSAGRVFLARKSVSQAILVRFERFVLGAFGLAFGSELLLGLRRALGKQPALLTEHDLKMRS